MKIKLNQWQHDAACASSSDIMIYIYVNCTPCIALGIMFFLFPVRSDDLILSRSDDLISFWSSDRILPLKKGRDF